MRRFTVAMLLALPGIALGMAAKPLLLGEGTLFAGIVLAFLIPLVWVATRTS